MLHRSICKALWQARLHSSAAGIGIHAKSRHERAPVNNRKINRSPNTPRASIIQLYQIYRYDAPAPPRANNRELTGGPIENTGEILTHVCMDANVSISQPAGVAGAAAEASRLKPGDSEVNNLCLRLSRWLRRFRDCGHLADQSAAQRAA